MKIRHISASFCLAALLGVGVAPALAQSKDSGYWKDQSGTVWRNSTGLCWRASYWTPAMATEECDPDLVKKPEAPRAAPPAAAPAPAAPAPAPAPAAPAVAPAPVKPTTEKVSLSADALFDFDKATLRPDGQSKLDELAGKIKDVKIEVIIAVGHADRIGTTKYNQKLSERRAEAVKAYLVSKGIERNRVYTEGKGEAQPVTTTCVKMGREHRSNKKLVECLQPDRRVEIEVIGTRTR